jgi:hypothetical protein
MSFAYAVPRHGEVDAEFELPADWRGQVQRHRPIG